MIKIVFVPGNGGASTKTSNWFPRVKEELESFNLQVIAEDFPDADLARESYWIPFLREIIQVDDETILVGHSTGAIAAMRFAEQYPVLGSVLIGAYHTDLNMEKEKLSGYFSRPWNWKKIRHNQKWISLFASEDDQWIPIQEARYVHKRLNCEYHEYKNQGHFGGDYLKKEFPELTLSILNFLRSIEKV